MSYTALVLDPGDHQRLVALFKDKIPVGWTVYAHHMTINMGAPELGPAKDLVGERGLLRVTSFAQDERVMAVGVESEVPSSNAQKHVTLAVNQAGGGKPFHSNQLTNWQTVFPLELHGVIQEVL